MQKVHSFGRSASPSMEVDLSKLAAPGVRGTITVLAYQKDDTRRDEDRLSDKTTRRFTVATLLTKFPTSSDNLKGDFTATDGSSYVRVAPDHDHIVFAGSTGGVRADKNAAGELSMISTEISAATIEQARIQFLEAAGPMLDYLSYIGNIPLSTGLVRVVDQIHDVQELEFASPHRPVIIGNMADQLHHELLPAYAIYREAKNSNSVFYQLLCYYKIIEGIQKLRNFAVRRARHAGISLNLSPELVPDHDDLAPNLRSWVGKSIKSFYDKVLTDQFRDTVAHYILKEGTMLRVSSAAAQLAYSQVAFASELCARAVVSGHELLLSAIQQAIGSRASGS